MSHSNISVFVTNLGCPNQCSFCDQRHITGSQSAATAEDVRSAVMVASKSQGYNPKTTELAFFGGSFTAIDREYMLSLLEASYAFIKDGVISGIRISTRPDAIDDEVLSVLKSYGVTAIELGAQSLLDDVLVLNKRGHTATDVEAASKKIRDAGFELGLQMMTGLYGSDPTKDRYTAQKIIELKPKTVRIYPTITLKNTMLAEFYDKGLYTPPSLDETVSLCSELKQLFDDNGIKVIRLGLHTVDVESIVAGPWHPSFGELCDAEIMYRKAKSQLCCEGKYVLLVNGKFVSKMTGQKKSNLIKLQKEGYLCRVVADDGIAPGDVKTRKDE